MVSIWMFSILKGVRPGILRLEIVILYSSAFDA